MTKSTDTKNIKKIVRSILESNGIDNLKLEVDLVCVWQRYVAEREDGLSPAELRLKIADEYNDIGISDVGQRRNIVKQEFMDIMGVDFGSEDNEDWSALLSFLVESKSKGETIGKFAEWCKTDPYNSPKKHQIAQSPLLVKRVWRSAFVADVESKTSMFERM